MNLRLPLLYRTAIFVCLGVSNQLTFANSTLTAATNHTPIANSLTQTFNEDTVAKITLTATDADNDKLTYKLATMPTNGTVALVGNITTYTPKANFNGQDSFTFKANDGKVDSAAATVKLVINPVNDAPIASPQTVTLNEDKVAKITLTATDVDKDILTYKLDKTPANGVVNLVGNIATYTPKANFNGQDSFTFKANDGKADSAAATVSLTVNPVNDVPVASPQTIKLNEDTITNIPLPATDVDNEPLKFSIDQETEHGVLSVNNNIATFTPDPNYNGTDSFTFKASDKVSSSATVKISLIINPINDAPRADLRPAVADWGLDPWQRVTSTPDVAPFAGHRIKLLAAGGGRTIAQRADGSLVQWGCYMMGYAENADECEYGKIPTGLSNLKDISVGVNHTVAVKADGTVVAWGHNEDGQTNVPSGLSNVRKVVAGLGYSLALTNSGQLVSWGGTGWGGADIPADLKFVRIRDIAASGGASFALKEDGTIVAWGAWGNSYGLGACPGQSIEPPPLTGVVGLFGSLGQTGGMAALKQDGTVATWGCLAQPPEGLNNVKTLAVHGWAGSTLALRNDGTVVAWGDAAFGADQVPAGLANVKMIAAGMYHSVAVLADGSVVMWGDTTAGQHSIVGRATDLLGVKSIAAGPFYSLALNGSGKVIGWGDDINYSKVTARIPADLGNVTAIAAGYSHAVALKQDGTVTVWGSSSDGSDVNDIPVGLSSVKAIAAGPDYSVALKTDGSTVQWGWRGYGSGCEGLTNVKAIAVDAGGSSPTPICVPLMNDGTLGGSFSGREQRNIKAVDIGGTWLWALLRNGTLYTEGANVPPANLNNVKSIVAGGTTSVALKYDGTLIAWSADASKFVPVPAGLKNVQSIDSSGGDHFLALYLKEAPFTASTFKNQSIQIPLPGWDADGDTLTYNLGRPAHGTVVLNGNGLATYTPTSGYVGLDSFSLTVSDGKTTSQPTIIGITVAAP